VCWLAYRVPEESSQRETPRNPLSVEPRNFLQPAERGPDARRRIAACRRGVSPSGTKGCPAPMTNGTPMRLARDGRTRARSILFERRDTRLRPPVPNETPRPASLRR
jgi:hypothetical protein